MIDSVKRGGYKKRSESEAVQDNSDERDLPAGRTLHDCYFQPEFGIISVVARKMYLVH